MIRTAPKILFFCSSMGLLASCPANPECWHPNFGRSECRVVAENELARHLTATGIEIRFQEADAQNTDSWAATGLLEESAGNRMVARVAHPGDFARPRSFELTAAINRLRTMRVRQK